MRAHEDSAWIVRNEGRAMAQANINDRLTLERLYPREAFDRDSRLNAEVKAEVLHGLKITSAPDSSGAFRLVRASRHVAELNPEGDVVFVFPHGYRGDDALIQGPDYGGPEERKEAPSGGHDTAYERFIDQVVEAAQSADFKPAIGCRESRLEGFHGG
jgi:hypothetical protein